MPLATMAKARQVNSKAPPQGAWERKWQTIMHRPINIKKAIRASKFSILPAKDRQTRLKAMHRALQLKHRRPDQLGGGKCRLCSMHDETHLHLTACSHIKPIWKWSFEIITALEEKTVTATATKIIFGMDHDGNSLLPGSLAILDLAWKHGVYWHLWRVDIDQIPFSHTETINAIIRKLFNILQGEEMQPGLARRNFPKAAQRDHINRQRRGKKARNRASPIVKHFDPDTRQLIIHQTIMDAFDSLNLKLGQRNLDE